MEKIMILIIVILIAVLAKVLKQDFFSPAVINIYWNAFFILGAVVIFGAGIDWKYGGIIWLLLSCAACLIGQVVGTTVKFPKYERRHTFKRNYLYLILVAAILLGIIEPLLYVRAFGYAVTDLLNINKLLQLNTEVAYDRYYGHQYNASAISSVLSIIIYMAALIGGYVFNYMKKCYGKILAVATLIPVLLLAIVTNAKVGVIASVFLWFIGWVLQSIHEKRTGKILSLKLIIGGLVIAVLGIIFLDITMLMRIGSIDRETQLIVNQKLQEYAFGQIHSFTVWFQNMDAVGTDFGSNTFMFFTNWFGITERKQGVYDMMPGVVSNIFTINRGVIADFGVIGGLVFWMMNGFLGGVTYKKVMSGVQNCTVSMVLLGTIYFMILYGFIISPWIYSSYVLAFVGFGVFLIFIKKVRFSLKR